MQRKKKKIDLGIYSPPDDGASFSEEGAQKEDGVEKTESSLSAADSGQEAKRTNKKKSKDSVNLGIF